MTFRRAVAIAEPWIDNKAIEPHCFNLHFIGPFNNLAWKLARRPPAQPGDAALAVRLAQNRRLGTRPVRLLEHPGRRALPRR